jgi:large repetitive protein
MVALSLAIPGTAAAAPPKLNLETNAPESALLGTKQAIQLVAENPEGQPRGYNLSFRVVLPKNVAYVPGSGKVAPKILENEPHEAGEEEGQTTLIFENVGDLSAKSIYDLGFEVEPSTTFFDLAKPTYEVKAEAFISEKPRRKPRFEPNGKPIANAAIGSVGKNAIVELTAIEIEKSDPVPEGEILRGVHEHQTVYTLTVKNNHVGPTAGIEGAILIEDWLPAGLEFLGCGKTDHTTNAAGTNPGSAEEYPGSGKIDPGNAPAVPLCFEPVSVETEEIDPPGPLPKGVYTHVVWHGPPSLAVEEEFKLEYVAAIPILQNSMTWSGAKPSAASLGQMANLDNNQGPETFDEEELTNLARAEGEYEKTKVHDTDELTRTAEDLAIQKSVDQSQIFDGAESIWSLNVETSEYRWDQPVSITDQLPNGLCPLGPRNYEGGPGEPTEAKEECEPSALHPIVKYKKGGPAGKAGTEEAVEYSLAEEEAEGGFKLEFNDSTVPALAHLVPSQELLITYPTATRTFYQHEFKDANPVLTGDSWTNEVETEGQAFNRCYEEPKAGEVIADPNCEEPGAIRISPGTAGPITVKDVSEASQEAGGVEIEKTVRENSGLVPVKCEGPNSEYVKGIVSASEPALPKYRPGDEICWRLVVRFASNLYAGAPVVSDFIPPDETYVQGSQVEGAENTVEATFNTLAAEEEEALEWTIGKPGSESVEAKQVFEYRFKTKVTSEAKFAPGEVSGNLMKFRYSNTAGQTFPLRERAEVVREEPELALSKAVTAVNGKAVTAPVTVHGGDKVTYSLGLSNAGNLKAIGTEVWDVLPKGVNCEEDVETISAGGECEGTTRIVWTGIAVPTKAEIEAGATAAPALTYVMTAPSEVAPGHEFLNHSGITHFESETNTGTNFEFVPEKNIAGEAAGEPNTGPANAEAAVTTSGAALEKTYTTLTNQSGNTATQATIGELVEYTVTATVPHNSTLYGSPVLSDPLPAGLELVSATSTLNGKPLGESELTLTTAGNEAKVQFPPTYTNARAEDDHVVVKIVARVKNVAGNKRGAEILNTATFKFEEKGGEGATTLPAATKTPIVEPHLGLGKTSTPATKVNAGQIVKYVVSVSDLETAEFKNVSAANEVVVKDTVPAGMKVTNPGTGTVVGSEIEWKIAEVKAGQTVKLEYEAEVEKPAKVASVFTNKVTGTTQSLPNEAKGVVPPETRQTGSGYEAKAEKTLSLMGATATKEVEPLIGTIGTELTYNLHLKMPAFVNYFNTTIVDTLPPGVAYDQTVSAECTTGCPPGTKGEAFASTKPSTTTPGATFVGWHFGSFTASPEERVLTVELKAHIKEELTPGSKVLKPQALQNSVVGLYNSTEKAEPTEVPTPGSSGFTEQTAPATATTTVVEPSIELHKAVTAEGAGVVQPGGKLTYTLTVTNSGTSTAFETQVTDSNTTTNLQGVVPGEGAAFLPTGWTSGDPLVWTIPTIEATHSVTLTYTAEPLASAKIKNGEAIDNTAAVPTYFGLPKAEREAASEFRTYKGPTSEAVAAVELPRINVVKTTGFEGFPDLATAEVGKAFPWRVVVTNEATTAGAKAVIVEDLLPPSWKFKAGTTEFVAHGGATVVAAANPEEPEGAGTRKLVWSNIATLPGGASVEVLFDATPTAVAGGEAPAPGLNKNVATGHFADLSGATKSFAGAYEGKDGAEAELVAPELLIEKTPDGGTAVAGAIATYEIKVTNEGTGPATEVEVEDVLQPGQTYEEPSSFPAGVTQKSVQPNTPGAGETRIVWTVTSLAAGGGTVTIPVPVKVPAAAVTGSEIKDLASVSAPQEPTKQSDGGSSEVVRKADLGIVKTASATSVPGGQNLTYFLEVENHGPSDATGIKVTDPLPAATEFVKSESGCTVAAKVVTCELAELKAETVEGHNIHKFEFEVHVISGAEGVLENTATVKGNEIDEDPGNDSSTLMTPLGNFAELSIVKTGPERPVLLGGTFDYKLQVKNEGPSDAVATEVTDELPAQVKFLSAKTSVGTCDEAPGGTLTCQLGTLLPTAEVTVEVTVEAVEVGNFPNEAKVASTTTDAEPENNHSEASVEVLPAADLAITKTAAATVEPNGELTYGLHVEDLGPSVAHHVVVTDPLPAGVTFVSASEGCAAVAGVVSCEVQAAEGELAVGEAVDFKVTVHVPFALGGQALTNTASVAAEEADPHSENNQSTVTTMVGPAADLSITKTMGAAQAGKPLTYTLAVTNHGPSASSAVTVKDTLPAGTTFKSAAPSQGSCSVSGQTVTCALGALASGGSAQVSITVEVAATATGTLRNVATVEGPEPDPDKANNESAVEGPVAPAPPSAPNLRVVKTVDTTSPMVGTPFDYHLAITNLSGAEAKNVKVIDTLDGPVKVLSVESESGHCHAIGSKIECLIPSIPVGKTVHVTYSVVAEAVGKLSNTASVEAANGETDPANNHAVKAVHLKMPEGNFSLTKTASRKVVPGGGKVGFTITLRNGPTALVKTTVCDRLPAALVFVKAAGAAYMNGEACWQRSYVAPHKVLKLHVMTRAVKGYVARRARNVATASAADAHSRSAAATVRVKAAFAGAAGGVTG